MQYHKRGVHVCRNGLQIRQEVLDQAVLDVLAGALDADVIGKAVEAAAAELRASQAERVGRRASIARELDIIAGRERRLLDALADGDLTAGVIRDRLREELARREGLTSELAALDTSTALDVDELLGDVTARAADLRGLLGRHGHAGEASDPLAARGATRVRALRRCDRAGLHVQGDGNIPRPRCEGAGDCQRRWWPQRDSNPCFSLERAVS